METEEAGPAGDRDQSHRGRVEAARSSAAGSCRGRPCVDENSRDEQDEDRHRALADQAPPETTRRVVPLEPRPHDEVVHGTPAEGDADDRDLDEQGLAVRRRPEVGDARQSREREVRARQHEDGDEHGCDPREAEEGSSTQLRRERPHARSERHEAADPEHRRGQVEPVGERR